MTYVAIVAYWLTRSSDEADREGYLELAAVLTWGMFVAALVGATAGFAVFAVLWWRSDD